LSYPGQRDEAIGDLEALGLEVEKYRRFIDSLPFKAVRFQNGRGVLEE